MRWGSGLRLMLLLLNGHRVEVGDGVVNNSVAAVGRWYGGSDRVRSFVEAEDLSRPISVHRSSKIAFNSDL
jgi:hypothetical protein